MDGSVSVEGTGVDEEVRVSWLEVTSSDLEAESDEAISGF